MKKLLFRLLLILMPAVIVGGGFWLLGVPELAALAFLLLVLMGVEVTEPRPERGQQR